MKVVFLKVHFKSSLGHHFHQEWGLSPQLLCLCLHRDLAGRPEEGCNVPPIAPANRGNCLGTPHFEA